MCIEFTYLDCVIIYCVFYQVILVTGQRQQNHSEIQGQKIERVSNSLNVKGVKHKSQVIDHI